MAEPGAFGPGSTAFAATTADGLALRGAALAPEGARATALIFQGRTEFLEKYAPVAADLAACGFAVAGLDWRGQGGSPRLLPNPRKGHVGDFADFQRDVDALVAATADLPRPRLLVAHSMGGAIGLRALGRGLDVAAAVFSAPMWGLKFSSLAEAAARATSWTATRVGLGSRYAFGGGDALYVDSGFEGNLLTADREQFERLRRLGAEAPVLTLGGVTWGWLRAAFDEIDALAGVAPGVPTLVAAGGEEGIVSLAAIRAKAGRFGLRLVEIPGGRHELLIETPERQARLWAQIEGFLAANGLAPVAPSALDSARREQAP